MKVQMFTKNSLLIILLGIGLFPAGFTLFAQDLSEYINSAESPETTTRSDAFAGMYAGNGQTTTLAGDKELMMFISHRFGLLNGGVYEMFGLDDATMRLGFDYGFLPWFTAGFGRSTWEKTWDLHAKTRLLSQSEHGSPLTAVLYGQAAYNSQRNTFPAGLDDLTHRMSYSAQALFSRKFNHFSLQLAPIYLNSLYDPMLTESAEVFSLGLGGSIRITKRIDINLEYYAGIVKPDNSIKDPLTIVFDFDTGGHLFQLVLSNARGMFDKALLLHTYDSWGDGGIYFGFNLVRVFYP